MLMFYQHTFVSPTVVLDELGGVMRWIPFVVCTHISPTSSGHLQYTRGCVHEGQASQKVMTPIRLWERFARQFDEEIRIPG